MIQRHKNGQILSWKRSRVLFLILSVSFLFSVGTGAEEAVDKEFLEKSKYGPEAPAANIEEKNEALETVPGEEVSPDATPASGYDSGMYSSVLFTYWEHQAIRDARNSMGVVRAPSEAELAKDLNQKNEVGPKPPTEERDISLGGIVYVAAEDWTIWLNGQRVTPKAIPSEIIDLKVYNEYIELKWFDEYTNRIFPIRLRPHQRFNIDTRIFLPG